MFHTEDLFLFRGMITWVVECYMAGWVSSIQRNLRFFFSITHELYSFNQQPLIETK